MGLESESSCEELSDFEDESNMAKNQVNIFRPEKSFKRPIMLVYNGSARCINKAFPNYKFVAKRMTSGSIMGESDTIQSIGIEFFGDIYAEKEGLQCLVIEKPDLVLDIFEQKLLKSVLGSSNHDLKSMLETRFKPLRDNPIKNY